MSNNIILTGIPRSGTTLVCSLLSRVKNCLAMVEPLNMQGFLACDGASERRAYLEAFFALTRQQAHGSGSVNSLVIEGESTNTFSNSIDQKRKAVISGRHEMSINKVLNEDFLLIIKHPNAFSALLAELAETWPCYAIVRNPLSVLASWHSLDHPLSKGHAPMAEAFDPALAGALAELGDALDRQLELIDWYFVKYLNCLGAARVITYESVISTGGKALSLLVPAANTLVEPLESRNRNSIYSDSFLEKMKERLLARGGAWQQFYTAEEIEDRSLIYKNNE